MSFTLLGASFGSFGKSLTELESIERKICSIRELIKKNCHMEHIEKSLKSSVLCHTIKQNWSTTNFNCWTFYHLSRGPYIRRVLEPYLHMPWFGVIFISAVSFRNSDYVMNSFNAQQSIIIWFQLLYPVRFWSPPPSLLKISQNIICCWTINFAVQIMPWFSWTTNNTTLFNWMILLLHNINSNFSNSRSNNIFNCLLLKFCLESYSFQPALLSNWLLILYLVIFRY